VKLRIMSDLHVEFGPYELPQTDVDAVVLAGDVHVKTNGVAWILKQFGNLPVIYVPGNHEYYGKALPRLADKLKEVTSDTNIHVLENDCVTIRGVRFLGCTLWTDFALLGDAMIAKDEARSRMSDYKKIRMSDASYRKIYPNDTARIHSRSMRWLRTTLEEGRSDETTIVVTHHAPSILSVEPKDRSDPVSAAYASNLEEMVSTSGATLWTHGHIHSSSDYMLGPTRVICNPRGYEDDVNPRFNPSFIVEV